jgi:translocation and assembly module TamB
VRVTALQGSWASATVDVKDLAVTPKGATGSGHLAMTHLEELKGLVGQDLGGGVTLDLATSDEPGGKVTVTLRGDRLRSGPTGVVRLALDAEVIDPLGSATTDATIKAENLSGVPQVSQATATVKGDRSAFDVDLKVAGLTSASLQARIQPTPDDIRVALYRLEARTQGIPVVLAAPTHLAVLGSRVVLDATSLRVAGGRVSLKGAVDPAASDLAVEVAGLPLALIDNFSPGTGLEGTVQAKAHLAGALANPRVQATYAADGIRIKRPETALLPALGLKGTLAMADRQATFDASLSAGSGTQLSMKGKAAIPQGAAPLAASVTIGGSTALAPFSPALGTSVRNIAGTLQPNLVLTINGEKISGSGTIVLSGASVYLPASGLRLTGGQATLALQGDTLLLQKLSFQTARNGEVSAGGTVRLDPAHGFPVDLRLTTKGALLANRPDILATVSSNIKVTGSLADGFDVAGPVTVDRAEIGIGVSQAANYPVVQVREINGGTAPDPTAPKPPPPVAGGKKPPKPPDGVRLALTINAPQAVFVRGRGLDAEMGGQFTVNGNPEAPQVIGSLALRRGKFDLLGRQLDFAHGNVSLSNVNEIDPELDFAATTTVDSTTIEVDITGSSRAPKIALTSSPQLPQDEAMAMLLFGKRSSSLSPVELLSAAQALAELTGGTPPSGGFLGRLRSTLGLDQLSVNSSSTTNANGTTSSTTALQGGRYVAPGVYVGAQQGASGDSSRGVIEIEVFKHTKIQGAIGADSNDKIGAKMEWDY